MVVIGFSIGFKWLGFQLNLIRLISCNQIPVDLD